MKSGRESWSSPRVKVLRGLSWCDMREGWRGPERVAERVAERQHGGDNRVRPLLVQIHPRMRYAVCAKVAQRLPEQRDLVGPDAIPAIRRADKQSHRLGNARQILAQGLACARSV